jgi:hypothetical protein
MSEKHIFDAELAVARARAQLLETIGELADRLEPRKIMNEVWDTAKEKGADIAGEAVDAVKRRPVATSGVLAALGMFLAREPIRQGIVNIYDAMTSEKDEDEEKPKAAPRARAPRKTSAKAPKPPAAGRSVPRRTTKKATTQ